MILIAAVLWFVSFMDVVLITFVSSFQIPCPDYLSSPAPDGFCFDGWIPPEGFVFQTESSFIVSTDLTTHTERECGHWRHDFAKWFREYAVECISA